MSLWQFRAVCGGVAKSNGADDGLSREEADDLAAYLDEPPRF